MPSTAVATPDPPEHDPSLITGQPFHIVGPWPGDHVKIVIPQTTAQPERFNITWRQP